MKNEILKEYLLTGRLENYGYDWKDFRRMSNTASKLRGKIRLMSEKEIRSRLLPNFDRLQFSEKRVNYIVFQSWNEEYLNLLSFAVNENCAWDKERRGD